MKLVFILGMHRSGTSCLAGSLERCGLFLGQVNRYSTSNLKGNHELTTVWKFHEYILKKQGGSWHQPPSSCGVTLLQRQTMYALAAYLSQDTVGGLKDPRLLLLLDSWLAVVKQPRLVGTFRHPLLVAESLAQRNQMPEDAGIRLWLHYNRELVRHHQRQPFPLIEFSLRDEDSYLQSVATVALGLGLHPNRRLGEFISAELEHHAVVERTVPAECQATYAYLQANRTEPAPSTRLDQLLQTAPVQSHHFPKRYLALRLKLMLKLCFGFRRATKHESS